MNPAVHALMVAGVVFIVYGALFRRFGDAWGRFFHPQGQGLFGKSVADRIWKNGDYRLGGTLAILASCLLFLVGFLGWIGVLNASQ